MLKCNKIGSVTKVKKCLLVVISFIFINFLVIEMANARVICSQTELGKLKNIAYQVQLNYEVKKEKTGGVYFVIGISNIPEEVEVRHGGYVFEKSKSGDTIYVEKHYDGGETLEFEIYAKYGQPCVGERLYTKRITLPKYNIYSEYEECIEFEDFPMCNKWYSGKIESPNVFYSKLEEYKSSIKQEEVIEEEEVKTSFFEDHFVLVIFIIIVLLSPVVYIIIRKIDRRRKRVKLHK